MALPGKPTRSASTEDSYRKRTSQLIARARKELQISPHDALDHRQFVGWLVTGKRNWSRSTWRQNKASSAFSLEKEALNNPVAQEALDYLLSVDVDGCLPKGTRTSASKQKKLPLKDYRRLDLWLQDHRGTWNADVRQWLACGLLTGLRPVEWAQAGMVTHLGEPALRVRNAKASNNRANGTHRHIMLGGLSDEERDLIRTFVARANAWNDAGQYQRFYQGCAATLARTCRLIWPKRDSYPTLYSARHQFSADAKASGFSKEELAALMGHAADATAGIHYGRKTAGFEMVRVRPDPGEVALVRKVALGFGKRPEPKNTAKTTLSGPKQEPSERK